MPHCAATTNCGARAIFTITKMFWSAIRPTGSVGRIIKVHILSGADVFLQRLSEVVKFPQKTLPQLDHKRPIYREN